MTLGQFLDIEEKLKAGLSTTEEERLQHASAQEAFQDVVKNFKEHYDGVMLKLRDITLELPDVSQQIGQFYKAISIPLAPVFAEMSATFRELPSKIQTALLTLGKSGWYLDRELGMTELWEYEKMLLAGNEAVVDSHLMQHYEARLQDIEHFLVTALPHRGHIFRAAFAAHRRGEFELSVPVLLTQADGVCIDLTTFHLFMRESKKPEVAQYLATIARDTISAAFLSPIDTIGPINKNEKEREQSVRDQGLGNWRELNRHLVLHGESIDYGTQLNSLKAVSLVNYLVGNLGGAQKTQY